MSRESSAPPAPIYEVPEHDVIFDGGSDFGKEHSGIRSLPEEDADLVETREYWEPGEFQIPNVVPAFEIEGFKGMEVAATLRKKKDRLKKEINDPQYLNQDNIIVDQTLNFLAVADELGSADRVGGSLHLETHLPSLLRVCLAELRNTPKEEVVAELIKRQREKFDGSSEYVEMLTTRMVQMASFDLELVKKGLALLRAISQVNQGVRDTESKTTFCGGFVHTRPDGSRWAVLANIGDSGAEKQRANGEMIPLFHEDALLEVVIRSHALSPGQLREYASNPNQEFDLPINKAIAMAMGMSAKDAELMEQAGRVQRITFKKMKSTMFAAVGGSKAVAALAIRRFDPGDRLLLATDGIRDMFPHDDGNGTDVTKLEKAFRGKTETSRLDNLREEAVVNGELGAAGNKDDDDMAAISALFQ